MLQFHRRLPHCYPDGKWLFVTWHIHGSLPQALYPLPRKPSSGSTFVWMDRYLDSARSGPVYLAQEPIADIVAASLWRGVLLGQYELGAYAIMANHVHVLLLPKVPPPRLPQSLKGVAARQANLLLRRTGERFWQAESYDHCVRDESEWERIAAYIEDNPVKAGLVSRAGRLPMVQRREEERERRDESRRCSHEWLRHNRQCRTSRCSNRGSLNCGFLP